MIDLWGADRQRPSPGGSGDQQPHACREYWDTRLPTQLGMVSFHWASALGTARQRTAADPCSRYPGLHSNRTIEPAENSEPILRPYLGSGTELHWVSLVRGTAAGKAHKVGIGLSMDRDPRRAGTEFK